MTIDATDVRISGDIDFEGLDGADRDKADSFKDGAMVKMEEMVKT